MPSHLKEGTGGLFSLALYRFVIDSLPLAVVALDSEHKIIEFNPWGERLTGYSKDEVMGRHCGEIFQGEMCGNDCPLRTIVFCQKNVVQLETNIRNKVGKSIPVRMTVSGLFDKEGKLIGGVEVFQDISEMKVVEREKANLISMFAHDMRSSLTGIHGLGLRLLNKSADLEEGKQTHYLEIINREAGKLESLVDDFLEFSRLQAGKLNMIFSATSLDKELIELYETYQVKASQKEIKLQLQMNEALPIIDADVKCLHRIFTNLLDNALKFSHKGKTVTIAARETNQEVMVMIMDEGVGIASEELPYIFDLFHRGRNRERKEGYGIGLATVKAIVEGHGGRIHVASEPGAGSVFTVFLPKAGKSKQEKRIRYMSQP